MNSTTSPYTGCYSICKSDNKNDEKIPLFNKCDRDNACIWIRSDQYQNNFDLCYTRNVKGK